MEKARLKDISFDEADAALFNFKGDLLLKAKGIKYSILPKLNVLLEETLPYIRKIYGIEVFSENSAIQSRPGFREKRENDLKVDYDYADLCLGGSRRPIWDGFKRIDNKPAKIIPYSLGYVFNAEGLMLFFSPTGYGIKGTKESNEIFLNFLLENLEYIQTILSMSYMVPSNYYTFENKPLIRSFREMLEDYKREGLYDMFFEHHIKLPINYNDLKLLIESFVIFFPIYFSLLEIAQNKKCTFKDMVSKFNYELLFNDSQDENDEQQPKSVTEPDFNINIDEAKFIKAGIRWQVFERDDFKCVACGKSAQDGAILHVDHIIPRSKGGENTMENYQTLCHLCNIGKSNKSQIDLRKK